MTVLLVAAGGALGALGRWWLVARAGRSGATAAGGTLLVNILGSFVLGLVAGWSAHESAPGWVLPLLGAGLCGALTTYSGHALIVVEAAREGRARHALSDVVLSLTLTLLAVTLGWSLTSP